MVFVCVSQLKIEQAGCKNQILTEQALSEKDYQGLLARDNAIILGVHSVENGLSFGGVYLIDKEKAPDKLSSSEPRKLPTMHFPVEEPTSAFDALIKVSTKKKNRTNNA